MNKISDYSVRYRYIVLLFLTAFCSLLNIFPSWKEKIKNPNQMLLLFGFFMVLAVYLIFFDKKIKFSERDVIFIIFAVGFVFRLVYGISTDFNVRQHDMDYNYPTGHYAYIMNFAKGNGLPEEIKWQFYQPPAWHWLCSVFIRIQGFLKIPLNIAFENLQLISLFLSNSLMLISYRIFKYFRLEKLPLCIATAVVAFHPTFIILSASINNDILSITLSALSILFAIKWYRDPKLINIIFLALSIGLSMAVKLSGGLIALGVAFLFACKFFEKNGKKPKLIGQFSVFGIICCPLALWWQVRNLIKFDIPMTYVPMLSEKSNQYIGFRSVSERLFNFSSLSESVYTLRKVGNLPFDYFEFNIPVGMMKTSVFGEYYLGMGSFVISLFAKILFYSALFIAIFAFIGAIISLISAIRNYKTDKNSLIEIVFSLVTVLTLVVSYFKFCFEYAHFCTMDFRYIALTIVFGALYIGLLIKNVKNYNKIFGKYLSILICITVSLFMLSSLAVYASIA